jgi:hypothetical protein
MLSWSAAETGQTLDLSALVDEGELGIPAGRKLIEVGRASTGTETDAGAVVAVAEILGEAAAVYAAGVAGAFELLNRAVDAVGLPVGRVYRERMAEIIDVLGLDAFPHATH